MSGAIVDLLREIDKPAVTTKRVYSRRVLTNSTRRKLLGYQEDHVVKLINILLLHYFVLEASDTGVGKTYMAVAVCREMGRRPIIVCPKTLMYVWKDVLDLFGVEYYDIVNYETLKNGKSYRNEHFRTRCKCEYLEIVPQNPDHPNQYMYRWNVPDDAIVIFDEAHKCKDPSRKAGKLLLSTRQLIDNKKPVMLLSATIYENFKDMRIPFCLMGFINQTREYKRYFASVKLRHHDLRIRRSDYKTGVDYRNAVDNSHAVMIYREIHDRASRIRIRELGDKFPKNQICCQLCPIDDFEEIQRKYDKIAEHLVALREMPEHHLARIQKLKQQIELKKASIFVDQAKNYLDNGFSVIIFVNFLTTLEYIANELDIQCQIRGGQTMEDRLEAIRMFQENEARVIICQIRAGGVGISLHDIHGGHPRVTLISCPDSGSDLLQALGRAPRSGAKTPVLQRIVFVANVPTEESIKRNIERKLANISAINDGDVDGNRYAVRHLRRKRRLEKRA